MRGPSCIRRGDGLCLLLWIAGVNEQDELGRTALHVAIETQQLNIIDLLVVADQKTELKLMDNRGRTPLHAAVKTGRVDIVQVGSYSASL